MITIDISCDVCRESDCFSIHTKLSRVRKNFHHIKGKDFCCRCATKAIIDLDYIPSGMELITRNLTNKEKDVVYNFYCL